MTDAAERFAEYFENRPWLYTRRFDLAGLYRSEPALVEQLLTLQDELINSLATANPDRDEPFHLDYADGEHTAGAFSYAGYAFISLGLGHTIWLCEVARGLSKSPDLSCFLQVEHLGGDNADLQELMAVTLMMFVVGHEYAHHRFGHCSDKDTASFKKICSGSTSHDSLASQVDELLSDGYSLYFVLENFFGKPDHANSLSKIRLVSASMAVEEQLYAIVLAAIVGYWLSLREVPFDPVDVYKLGHPLPISRVTALMVESKRWCSQHQPDLAEFFEHNHVALIECLEKAVEGNARWWNQTAFLDTPEGQTYTNELSQGVAAFKAKVITDGLLGWIPPRNSQKKT